jgi:hypothetical protein
MKIDSLTKQAMKHTLHCLLGCSIGEILGMVISAWLAFSNQWSIVLSVVLAFFFGYLLTVRSLIKKNMRAKQAVKTALATDTISITSMEIVDNVFILLVPGAIAATLSSGLFWWSLLASLVIAFVITVPVNRLMIGRMSDANHHHH